jgi:uncharacterized membrane protein
MLNVLLCPSVACLQMAAHCLMFASLNVLVSIVAFIPLMPNVLLCPSVLCVEMAAHCLMFASLNVLVSTVAFIPLMLTSCLYTLISCRWPRIA